MGAPVYPVRARIAANDRTSVGPIVRASLEGCFRAIKLFIYTVIGA